MAQNVPNVSVHRVVVHANNFVDPATGIHTQEVQAACSRLKYQIKKEKELGQRIFKDSSMNMWRDWRGLDNIFDNILPVISQYYPLYTLGTRVSKATPKLHSFTAVCGDEQSEEETLVAHIASLTSVLNSSK